MSRPDLTAYLEGAMAKDDGATNCALFVADWIVHATGIDPASEWRSCDHALAAEMPVTKMVRVIIRTMDDVGFRRTAEPITGDIAMVRGDVVGVNGGRSHGVLCAIRHGNLWVARNATGIVGAVWPVVIAWRLREDN